MTERESQLDELEEFVLDEVEQLFGEKQSAQPALGSLPLHEISQDHTIEQYSSDSSDVLAATEAPLDPVGTKVSIAIVNQMHPELSYWDRAKISMFLRDDAEVDNYLKQAGFEVQRDESANVLVRRSGAEEFYYLDPDTGAISADFIGDLADLSRETLEFVPIATATVIKIPGLLLTPLSGGGSLAASMAIGGALTGATDYVMQRVGAAAGVREGVNHESVALSATVGALMPGAGRLAKGVGGKVIESNVAEALSSTVREGVSSVAASASKVLDSTRLQASLDGAAKALNSRWEGVVAKVNELPEAYRDWEPSFSPFRPGEKSLLKLGDDSMVDPHEVPLFSFDSSVAGANTTSKRMLDEVLDFTRSQLRRYGIEPRPMTGLPDDGILFGAALNEKKASLKEPFERLLREHADLFELSSDMVRPSGVRSPLTNALDHPDLPTLLAKAEANGVRVVVDPTMEFFSEDMGVSFMGKGIVAISPRAPISTLIHELAHQDFDKVVRQELGDVMLDKYWVQARTSGELKHLESLSPIWKDAIALAKKGFDEIAVDETLAVRAELKSLAAEGFRPWSMYYRRVRDYAQGFQQRALETPRDPRGLTDMEKIRLTSVQAERELLRRSRNADGPGLTRNVADIAIGAAKEILNTDLARSSLILGGEGIIALVYHQEIGEMLVRMTSGIWTRVDEKIDTLAVLTGISEANHEITTESST